MSSALSKQYVGKTGEKIAAKFLVKQGFKIVGKNYRKKFGEIDIIAKKGETLHFVEVKSVMLHEKPLYNVSHETFILNITRIIERIQNGGWIISVTNEIHESDQHTPEENVHHWKQQRLARTIEVYLSEYNVSDSQEFQIDIIAAYLDFPKKHAIIGFMENVVLKF